MKKRNIVITEEDRAQLSLMMEVTAPPLTERPNAQALEHELRRAEIVATDSVPPDVITMNSRAELLDLDTGEHLDLTLVFPSDANIDEGKISVPAPIGTGMLGYRKGSVFAWPSPNGIRRLKVIHVHFQPEAALAETGSRAMLR